jgi:hypothetical protein
MIVERLFQIFNNRELALIFWVIVLILASLLSKKVRPSILAVIRAFFEIRIIGVQFSAYCYSTLVIYIFHLIGLWNFSMLKDTIIWMIITSFFIILKTSTTKNKDKHFKELFFDSIKLIIVVEFLVNLFPFSLFSELIILPVFTILFLMKLIAEQKEEHMIVAKFLDGVFIIFGTVSIIISIWKSSSDIKNVVSYQNLLDLLFPIWITILFIPFTFLMLVYMRYEELFKWLNYRLNDKDKKLVRYLKFQTILKVGFRYKKLELIRTSANKLNTNSKDEINNKILSKL